MEFCQKRARLARRKQRPPFAHSSLADKRRRPVGPPARPPLRVTPHGVDTGLFDQPIEIGRRRDARCRRLAEETREASNRLARVMPERLVGQEQHVLRLDIGKPRLKVIEVVAEVDLAGKEAVEIGRERALGKLIMPGKAPRVMKKRDRAVERVTGDHEVPRCLRERDQLAHEMRLDQPRRLAALDRRRPDFLQMRKAIGQGFVRRERPAPDQQIHDVLQPGRARFRIARDEDVAGLRPKAKRGFESLGRKPERHAQALNESVARLDRSAPRSDTGHHERAAGNQFHARAG